MFLFIVYQHVSIYNFRFTNSSLMYDRLNDKLEWKHGRTYVPKGNKRLICLIDDLNLSHVSSICQ